MRIIKPGYEVKTVISPYSMYELMDIEDSARTCYRSEDKILDQAESAKKMVKNLVDHGHDAMLEFSYLKVLFTCDRAIANEIVRHRHLSFAQESTRYCNYSKDKFGNEISVIQPVFLKPGSVEYGLWISSCYQAENNYMEMLEKGMTPEEARIVLPLCLATKLCAAGNYRAWRHVFMLRTAKAAHPQMRELMIPLLKDLKERIPIIFDDIEVEE